MATNPLTTRLANCASPLHTPCPWSLPRRFSVPATAFRTSCGTGTGTGPGIGTGTGTGTGRLPFVGAWFPRPYYGRIFALLFTGFQMGYLLVSYYWQHLLFAGKLHWRVPFLQCTVGFALLSLACLRWLKERPRPPPARPRGGFLSAVTGGRSEKEVEAQSSVDEDLHAAPPRVDFGALMRKVSTRWVCWAMLLAAASYTPAVE